MLNVFRSKGLSSVVYGVIIVATILVFVIQFNPSAGKKTATLSETCAARVKGWCINPKDHMAAFRIMIPRGPQGELQTQKAKQMGLMKIALDGLIERELLIGEADRIGLGVNDDEVTEEIYGGFIHVSVPSDNPMLAASLNVMDGKVYAGFKDQKTKRFDLKVYERMIKALVGRSPTEFREEQARELVAAKVRDAVRTPVRVSEVEALESYVDEKSTANLTYVQVKQSWAAKYAVPTPPVDVDPWAKDPANQSVIDAAMKERGGDHIRHVLAKFANQPPSPAEKEAAKVKIDKALARIKGGEPFAAVAKEMSDDGSAASGGDVGEKTDGFVPPFRDAADKLKPGEMTPAPVETEFGFHLIMKDPVKTEAQMAAFKKDVIRELYAKSKAPDAAKSIADRLLVSMKGGKTSDDAIKDVVGPILASYTASHPKPAAAGDKAPGKKAGKGDKDAGADAAGPDAGDASAAPAAPAQEETAETDPNRPQTTTSASFTKSGDPIPTLAAESTADLMKFAFGGAAKDGDVLGESLKGEDGFTVVQLKQHKAASKEEFDKDRDTYLVQLVARKQAEALSLYVRRLKEQSKAEIKVDEKYLADKNGGKDGGAAPIAPGEDEDEGP